MSTTTTTTHYQGGGVDRSGRRRSNLNSGIWERTRSFDIHLYYNRGRGGGKGLCDALLSSGNTRWPPIAWLSGAELEGIYEFPTIYILRWRGKKPNIAIPPLVQWMQLVPGFQTHLHLHVIHHNQLRLRCRFVTGSVHRWPCIDRLRSIDGNWGRACAGPVN